MDDDLLAHCRWLDPGESGFGVRLFDCRAFCQTMRSATTNADIAARLSKGAPPLSAIVSAKVERPIAFACDLRYPCDQLGEDGLLFASPAMEFKWHAYQRPGELAFMRSWTGKLMFAGRLRHYRNFLAVDLIQANTEFCCGDSTLALRQFDFLVKSLVYDAVAVHPLPKSVADEPGAIASYSFSCFGRQGGLASYDDTVPSPIAMQMQNSESLAGKWLRLRRGHPPDS